MFDGRETLPDEIRPAILETVRLVPRAVCTSVKVSVTQFVLPSFKHTTFLTVG
jgi:hypothetical protein